MVSFQGFKSKQKFQARQILNGNVMTSNKVIFSDTAISYIEYCN